MLTLGMTRLGGAYHQTPGEHMTLNTRHWNIRPRPQPSAICKTSNMVTTCRILRAQLVPYHRALGSLAEY